MNVKYDALTFPGMVIKWLVLYELLMMLNYWPQPTNTTVSRQLKYLY